VQNVPWVGGAAEGEGGASPGGALGPVNHLAGDVSSCKKGLGEKGGAEGFSPTPFAFPKAAACQVFPLCVCVSQLSSALAEASSRRN